LAVHKTQGRRADEAQDGQNVTQLAVRHKTQHFISTQVPVKTHYGLAATVMTPYRATLNASQVISQLVVAAPYGME
jgi:hypothetical protein